MPAPVVWAAGLADTSVDVQSATTSRRAVRSFMCQVSVTKAMERMAILTGTFGLGAEVLACLHRRRLLLANRPVARKLPGA